MKPRARSLPRSLVALPLALLLGCGDDGGSVREREAEPARELSEGGAPPDATVGAPPQVEGRLYDGSTAKPTLDAGAMAPSSSRDAGNVPREDAAPPASTGDGGASVSGIAPSELAQLRQVCVDEINRYRATLSLPPIGKASEQQELCSDEGARKDGMSKSAHSSAGMNNPCVARGIRPGFRAQNTCPGWPVGRRGAATIADALKGCLKQMWDEGEPPGGTEKCVADYRAGNTACFLAHGHYINMKGNSKGVSCGFFDMGMNTYWMNQDFY